MVSVIRPSIPLTILSVSVSANEILYNPSLNYFLQSTYGTDLASFPTHHSTISTNSPFYPHRQNFYNEYLEGCRSHHHDECIDNESDRIQMNLIQPRGMLNYTDMGFRLISLPSPLANDLFQFWSVHRGKETIEDWFSGNSYANHWSSPTAMLDVNAIDAALAERIRSAAHSALQDWTGQTLVPTSLYGARVYSDGAVLAPHVDRMPLVTSAVINVAQDVDEPWVMELFGHDGKAYNVTMVPGDMLMYESHSVIHGRPWPMKGRHFVNVFVHFEPIGHSLQHGFNHSSHQHTHKSGYNRGLPPYIIDGSLEASIYRLKHGSTEWKPFHFEAEDMEEVTGSNGAHYAAHTGNLKTMLHILENERREMVHEPDGNGWLPIHEAARSGSVEIIRLLLDHGADVDSRTEWGEGYSTLHIALHFHDRESEVVKYLMDLGAQNIIPYPDEL